jgi:ABC-type multidrug transport system fused ATPase/permease subunit
MLDLAVYDRVEVILNPDRDIQDESRLHEEDLRTLWFSVRIEDQSEASQGLDPSFVYTDCYPELMKATKFDGLTAQFPSLVSFVGQTGAGKSTLIVLPHSFFPLSRLWKSDVISRKP